MIKGIVTDIHSFSLEDGPGIRTTVFLKGCPLKCLWCHNPETMRMQPQPSRLMQKCRQCGRCVEICPQEVRSASGELTAPERCVGCGRCASACAGGAIALLGHSRTVDEVLREVLRDRSFYEHSGGGVTVSGGEPMLQADFTLALLERCREEGIHTCMETSGYFDEKYVAAARDVTGLFLFDYKETDPELHRRWTGVSTKRIHKNLLALAGLGARIVLRCPIIPGYNDREDHFRGIARMAGYIGAEYVELMPYHNIGLEKARQIGMRQQEDIRIPTAEEKRMWAQAVRQAGCSVRVSGDANA